MKQITVESNWLGDIDGMTVAEAIKYLKKLPQDHRLNWWLEGDTHGCTAEWCLTTERPYTEQELAELAAQRKAKRIDDCEKAIDWYTRRLAHHKTLGSIQAAAWVEHDTQQLQKLQAKLKELKA